MNKTRTPGAVFRRGMRKTHTIYLTNMLHYHNALLQAAFRAGGYKLAIMEETGNLYADALPYISSDYCFPAVQIIGQMLRILNSEKTDRSKVAFIEPQAGSACRSDQVYNLMLRALHNAGYDDVPVLSLNASGKEKQPGFHIGVKMLLPLVSAVFYSDLLMKLTQQTRGVEVTKGSAEDLREKWIRILSKEIASGRNVTSRARKKRYEEIVADFMALPVKERTTKVVGITGEIYSKFSPVGNMRLEEFLFANGCETRMVGFASYMLFSIHSSLTELQMRRKHPLLLLGYQIILRVLKKWQKDMNDAIRATGYFRSDPDFDDMILLAEGIGGKSCITGDGWHVASEAAALIAEGCTSVLVTHPFGCLVSHVSERGILKKLRERYPDVQITSLEYDYGTTPALQQSRILMAVGATSTL